MLSVDDLQLEGAENLVNEAPQEQAQEKHKQEQYAPSEIDFDDELAPEAPEHNQENSQKDDEQESKHNQEIEEETDEQSNAEQASLDEYGNELENKTYTEEEVNERINKAVRERLARLERNHAPEQNQVAQHVSDNFEFDENSSQTWQQQLATFVKQTVQNMGQEQAQAEQYAREQRAQQEFEQKFHNGMARFKDFREVVGSQPITDAMTVATRSIKDPAAFLYAASKRMPGELERISKIPDQYAQIAEMGKLEEKLKKTKRTTAAPRPVSRSYNDSSISSNQQRQIDGDDLIASAINSKRQAFNRGR